MSPARSVEYDVTTYRLPDFFGELKSVRCFWFDVCGSLLLSNNICQQMELNTIIQQQSHIGVHLSKGQFNGILKDDGPDAARISLLDVVLMRYI